MKRVVKQILWSILAFLVIAHVQTLAAMLLHPMAGYEFHHIFAEMGGGRVDVALRVFVEYVGITSAMAFLLILFRYPAHWIIVASIACFIAWQRWAAICFFPYQSAPFHRICTPLLPAIPLIVMGLCHLSYWLSRRTCPRKRVEDQKSK